MTVYERAHKLGLTVARYGPANGGGYAVYRGAVEVASAVGEAALSELIRRFEVAAAAAPARRSA